MATREPDSFDHRVARNVADRLVGEAKAVAEMRDTPPDIRAATPDEELDLFDEWDPKVDPQAVMLERFAKYNSDGLPPDHALTEAVLDASAAGFVNRLRMSGQQGRLSLTEQTTYLEQMAMKSRARKEKASGQMAPELSAMDRAYQRPTDAVQPPDSRMTQAPLGGQPSDLQNLGGG